MPQIDRSILPRPRGLCGTVHAPPARSTLVRRHSQQRRGPLSASSRGEPLRALCQTLPACGRARHCPHATQPRVRHASPYLTLQPATQAAFSAAAAIIRVVGSAAVLSRIHALGLDSKRKERLVQLAQVPSACPLPAAAPTPTRPPRCENSSRKLPRRDRTHRHTRRHFIHVTFFSMKVRMSSFLEAATTIMSSDLSW